MTGYATTPPFNLPGVGDLRIKGPNALKWRQAVARMDLGTGTATVMGVGDSTVQGFSASSYANTVIGRIAAKINSRTGLVSSIYVPASTFVSYTGVAPVVAPGPLTETNDSGFCGEAAYIPVGSTLTFPTLPADRLWFHSQQSPALGAAYTYKINGGAAQGPVGPAGSPRKGGRVWDHGPIALAAQTPVVTPDGTFGSVIEGITYHSGTGNTSGAQGFITSVNSHTGVGPRVYKVGRLGYFTSSFAVPGFSAPLTSAARFTDPYEFVEPDVILIHLGLNDVTQGLSASSFLNNIITMVGFIQAHATTFNYVFPTLVLQATYPAAVDTTPYLAQMRALRGYCNVNGYGFIDLTQLIGNVFGNTTLSPDNLHPTDVGHRIWANYLFNYLFDD